MSLKLKRHEMLGDLLSVGEMVLRFCPVRQKRVKCHGICVGVFINENTGKSETLICPIRQKALDKALNRS